MKLRRTPGPRGQSRDPAQLLKVRGELLIPDRHAGRRPHFSFMVPSQPQKPRAPKTQPAACTKIWVSVWGSHEPPRINRAAARMMMDALIDFMMCGARRFVSPRAVWCRALAGVEKLVARPQLIMLLRRGKL